MKRSTAHVLRAPGADLADRVEDVLVLVRDRLSEVVAERRATAARYGAPCAQLWDDLGAGIGGKLLRPRLTLSAYLGLGGQDVSAVAPVAAAMEVLHTAMLVHDDLLDHDEVRRGRPNLAGTTRRRLAERGLVGPPADGQVTAAAVLAGDAGLATAFRLLATAPLAAPTCIALVDLLGATVEATVAGELLDVVSELADPDQVDVLTVAELKTAAYSSRLPLMAGGLAAGVGPQTLEVLGRVGVRLGVAYQLHDDVLGVLGDPGVTGKSVLSDLRDGKRTLLLQLAWRRADAAGRAVLASHVGDRGLDELGAARVRAVLRGTQAAERVRVVAGDLTDQALDLAATDLPPALADHLAELTDGLSTRGS